MLLWSGQLVSNIGSQVSQLAFPLVVLAITRSPAQAGLVGALRGLPFALLCLPAGALVDRWDRKRVILLSDWRRGPLPLAAFPWPSSKGRTALERAGRDLESDRRRMPPYMAI
jgi:hypothetical protein